VGIEMTNSSAGPHHCIGSGHVVAELVFRRLHALCVSSGGNLSLSELESFQSRFLNNFSSGFELFEAIHQHCMIASGVSVETPFSRNKILVTLLRGCGEEAAIHAFSLQIAQLGSVWTRGFFESFAGYVRQCVCVNADMRLINAYAVAAALPKIKVSTEVLLKLGAIQRILRECIGAFDPPEAQVEPVCNYINRVGAGRDGIGGPHISKITEHQVSTFLTLLPQEFRVRINSVNSSQTAHAP
jgi:hypothetical protein